MGLSVLTGTYFSQGDIACAEGAIASGCRFFAGYPITPATEIAEHMARRLPEVGGAYIQMEDELASMAAIIGASYAGIKSMTATSGPGFSLMVENIGLAVMTEAPCVVVNVMRGGPSTGTPTSTGQQDVMQAKWGPHGDCEIIALAPASVQEMFDFTVEAFNLSETYRVPAIVLADETVGHLRERFIIPESSSLKIRERKKKQRDLSSDFQEPELVPPMACFGEGFKVFATGLTHDSQGRPDTRSDAHSVLVTRLCEKIRKNSDRIAHVKQIYMEDAKVAVVSYGSVARSALEAVKMARKEGMKVGLLKLDVLWPFPERQVEDVASSVSRIVVPEMNCGQILREVQRVAGISKVVFLPKVGEHVHTPFEILDAVRG